MAYKLTKNGAIDWTKVVTGIAIVGVGYYLVIRPIFETLGITKSATDIENDQTEISGSAWNPNYWKSVPNAVILTNSYADGLADTIEGAFTIFKDNFSAVEGALKQLNHKTQVSYLADRFYQKNNVDLWAFLKDGGGIFTWWDGLSADNLKKLNDLVNTYPV